MATTVTPKVAPKVAPRTPQAMAQQPSGGAQAPGQPPGYALVPFGASGAVALPAEMQAELAGYAKDAAAKERPSITRISIRGGIMSLNGAAIPGNFMEAVVLCGVFKNVWYAGRYDADNIVNPNCFAMAENEEDLQAHEKVPDERVPEDGAKSQRAEGSPRACSGCSKNEWASDPNSPSGRGKWCKEGRRLILMPSDALMNIDDVGKAELAILDVPVTSTGAYGAFVNSLAAMANIPPWAAVAKVSVSPHRTKQLQVNFEPMAQIQDPGILMAVKARREEALRIALTPYDGVGGEVVPDTPVAKVQPPKTRKY